MRLRRTWRIIGYSLFPFLFMTGIGRSFFFFDRGSGRAEQTTEHSKVYDMMTRNFQMHPRIMFQPYQIEYSSNGETIA